MAMPGVVGRGRCDEGSFFFFFFFRAALWWVLRCSGLYYILPTGEVMLGEGLEKGEGMVD